MRWCRAHGIEPVTAERRSLQAWRRRLRVAAAAMALAGLLAAAAHAQQFCHETGGGCHQMPPFGSTCDGTLNSIPCPAVSPTPTAVPTATPAATATPTPLPGSALWTWLIKGYLFPMGLPNGWNYGQWVALNTSYGEVTSNYGKCCTDTGEGEILATIGFGRNPPQIRQWFKTYETPRQFEVIGATPFDGTKRAIVFATTERWWNLPTSSGSAAALSSTVAGQKRVGVRPPWGPLRAPRVVSPTGMTATAQEVADFHELHVGYVRYTDLNDPRPEIEFRWIVEPDTQLWPLGMMRIGGVPYLYVKRDKKDGADDLVRYRGEPPNTAVLDPDFVCAAPPWIEDIGFLPYREILIAVGNADYANRTVDLYESRDQGRSWLPAVFPSVGAGNGQITAPSGALWMCKLAKDGNGWITEPFVLTCMRSAKGGFVTEDPWLPFWLAWPSSRMQLTWGLQPIPWRSPTP